MSKTYTITPNIVGYSATSSVNGSSDDLTAAGSELRSYTTKDGSNIRIGCTSSYATGYAVRCNWPSTDEVNHLLSLPDGISITAINIVVTTTISSSGNGIRVFYGPLYGSANGARLKTKCNTYAGYTSGTANFTLKPSINKFYGSDGRSLCQYGFGMGGTRSSIYRATIKTITVTVTTDEETHDLTTSVTPSGYGTVESTQTSGYYGDISILTATPAAETSQYTYSFSEWELSGEGSLSSTTDNPTTFTYANSAATVTANFTRTPKSYTLTTSVTPSEGGTVTAGEIIAYGSTKSLTATPNTGYVFTEWRVISGSGTLSSTTSNPTIFTGGYSDTEVRAVFVKSTLEFQTIPTYSTDGGTTYVEGITGGTTSPTSGEVLEGETVTITATPNTGYEFVLWDNFGGGSIADETSATTTLTGGSFATTVYARFSAIQSSLSTDIYPNDTYGSVTDGQDVIYYSNTKTLTATPRATWNDDTYTYRYDFINWSKTGGGTISSTTSQTITFTAGTEDATVVANFRLTKIPISGYSNIIHYCMPYYVGNFNGIRQGTSYVSICSQKRTATGSGVGSTSTAAQNAAKSACSSNLRNTSFGSSSWSNETSTGYSRIGGRQSTGGESISIKSTGHIGIDEYLSTASGQQSRKTYIYAQEYILSSDFVYNVNKINNVTLHLEITTGKNSTFYIVSKANSSSTPVAKSLTWTADTKLSFNGSSTLDLNVTDLIKYILSNGMNSFFITQGTDTLSSTYMVTPSTLSLTFTYTNGEIIELKLVDAFVYRSNGSILEPASILYKNNAALVPTE